jgi:hypothetical protein
VIALPAYDRTEVMAKLASVGEDAVKTKPGTQAAVGADDRDRENRRVGPCK